MAGCRGFWFKMCRNSNHKPNLYDSRQVNTHYVISLISRLVIICLGFVLATPADSQNFSFPSFDNPSIARVKFVNQNTSWYTGSDVQGSDDSIWLTMEDTRKNASIGKMIYKDPITFKSPEYAGMASFNTSFTFNITTTRDYPYCGSGMVFFIADYYNFPEKSYGRYLGMVSPNMTLNAQLYRFFAVEFDTHISTDFSDISGSHIGINVNSLNSCAVADTSPNSTNPEFYPKLFLYNNYTFTAWVEYNSSTNLTQVWVTNSSTSQRPSTPCVSLKKDLSTVFKDTMFVGFSASNNASEDGRAEHVLFSWNFTTDYHPKGPGPNKLMLIPLIIVVIGVIAVSCICFFVWKTKQKSTLGPHGVRHSRSDSVVNPTHHFPSNVPKYSLQQLCKATDNFKEDNLIGRGGYGLVYRGELQDGSTVAVKRLKDSLKEDEKLEDFVKELDLIGNIKHKNLLQLQGWCYENNEALFVYEYMKKGSLERYLEGGKLASRTRMQILAGVASALRYLHFGLGHGVLMHRDVKAANVLLTDDFQPLLGDFGMARIISNYLSGASITMTAAGTTGYMAPEVALSGKFSVKVDVYAFGVLALEVACGRRAICRVEHSSECVRLLEWVCNLHLKNELVKALDSTLCFDKTPVEGERWKGVLHLALLCCSPLAKDRPDMRQVCQILDGDQDVFLGLKTLPKRTRECAPPLELYQASPFATESLPSAR